ncbi:type I restriction enzyme HsdR N-terminal domain-containing protein [Chromatium okenii]|uniref:type I restriction enzyme HsdR N-terminal domain-containing protein n=1 Tax=Chromatium okenii TaxID=61644 RepID=UPI0018D5246E|nr:type I restriction enzyme HsdR N-terminal domain-containing protein [Chromatium okenii]
MNNQLFQDFDFAQLHSPDFKEDSVREVLILPILTQLGYGQTQIIRSKSLLHPFLTVGSKSSKKRPITLIPDYLLKVENSHAWVLDAKAPHQHIQSGDHVAQFFLIAFILKYAASFLRYVMAGHLLYFAKTRQSQFYILN